MIIHRERPLAVPGEARQWVDSMVEGDLREGEQVVLEGPDHAVTLALRLDRGFEEDLVVMGPRTRAVYHAADAGRSWLKVRLKPGAARGLIGGATAELVDQVVPLAAVTGDRVVRRMVAGGKSTLLAGLSADLTVDDRAALVRSATDLLARGLKVEETARRLHLSERQLRTMFTSALGISPKQYARISRVRAVIDRTVVDPAVIDPAVIDRTVVDGSVVDPAVIDPAVIDGSVIDRAVVDRSVIDGTVIDPALIDRTVIDRTGRRPLAQVAIDAGYYDQAHLTREFKALMGVPPAAFAKGKLPAATACQSPA